MDLQKFLDNAVEAARAEEMKSSDQLMLGELILKLEAIADKSKNIIFDFGGAKPTGLGSWRGSYRELAIQFEDGGSDCYEQPKPDCKRDEQFGYHMYDCPCGQKNKHDTSLPKVPKVDDLLAVLKMAMGKYFVGYKGGDFTMGKNTPIWVANYGDSSITNYKDAGKEAYDSVGVVDIQDGKIVKIITKKFS